MQIDLQYKWTIVKNEDGSSYTYPQSVKSFFRKNWNTAAVYRWMISNKQGKNKIYIGETEFLPSRISQYVNPGPSQKTNQRLKQLFEVEIKKGNRIYLEVLIFEDFKFGDFLFSMNTLDDKNVRCFLENYFLIHYKQNNKYELLNR